MAYGGLDERTPLCLNIQEEEGATEDSRQQSSLHHRHPAPLRARAPKRVTVESQRDAPFHHHGGIHNVLTSSLELSHSGEFVSIEGSDVTTQALELCEKWALKHYRRVLMALGWIPPQGECYGPHTRRALHVVLVTFWTLVILGAFIAQILSCFRRDKFLAYKDHNTWKYYNISCHELEHSHNIIDIGEEKNALCRTLYCDHHHFISDYVLFDVLLLVVYLYGVYLFRSEDGDLSNLHNLASRAFVMNSLSSQVSNKRSSNWKLLLSIMFFCVVGCLWIVVSLVVRILTTISADLMEKSVAIRWNTQFFFEEEKVILVVFSLVGFLFFDMVYMAATMNYVVQSELLVWLVSSVTTLLYKNEYPNIDAGIKDILECRRYLRTLNGRASTAVAMIIFILGNMGTLALLTLNKVTDYDDDPFKQAVAVMNIVVWFSLISLPLIQATRVTRTCYLLKDAACEIRSRPQLYANTSQLDLDSLLLLSHVIRLRATLFGVPMAPSIVYGIVAIVAFAVILLIQTDIYSFASF